MIKIIYADLLVLSNIIVSYSWKINLDIVERFLVLSRLNPVVSERVSKAVNMMSFQAVPWIDLLSQIILQSS